MAQKQVLTLTDQARQRVREILAKDADNNGLRVSVKNGGCAGMSYTLDYVKAPEPHDEVFHDNDINLYIDTKALLFLLGTEMDFETTDLSSGFVFRNPNQTSACGCGESVALQAVPAEVLHQALSASRPLK